MTLTLPTPPPRVTDWLLVLALLTCAAVAWWVSL